MATLLEQSSTDLTALHENGMARSEARTDNWTGGNGAERPREFPIRGAAPCRRTGADVERAERGEQFGAVRNAGESGRTRRVSDPAETIPMSNNTIRRRSEAARDLRNRLDDLLPLVGQVAFATHLQLLKRELSRVHDLLADEPSESSFLSIVTLIESALSQQRWKEYTREQLQLIRDAVDVGYRQPQVTFRDYEGIRRRFSRAGIDSRARIELDAFSLDDLSDDDDEE